MEDRGGYGNHSCGQNFPVAVWSEVTWPPSANRQYTVFRMTLAIYETLKVRAVTWRFDFCGADYELLESCVGRENEI